MPINECLGPSLFGTRLRLLTADYPHACRVFTKLLWRCNVWRCYVLTLCFYMGRSLVTVLFCQVLIVDDWKHPLFRQSSRRPPRWRPSAPRWCWLPILVRWSNQVSVKLLGDLVGFSSLYRQKTCAGTIRARKSDCCAQLKRHSLPCPKHNEIMWSASCPKSIGWLHWG